MKTRTVLLKPAAAVALSSTAPSERQRLARVIEWLKYPVTDRPHKIPIHKSTAVGQFIVRATHDLRVLYHKQGTRTIIVDDIVRRASFDKFLRRTARGPK